MSKSDIFFSHFERGDKTNILHLSYDRIGHLEKHIAAVHDKEKEIKVYLCSMCDSQFKSMAGVTFHMVTEHEGKKPRQCSECNFNR